MDRTERKAATRSRVLALAAARLRREGPGGTAVHRLMREAGLTHGGFYVHFDSKDALDVAAFRAAMADRARLGADLPPDLPRNERRKRLAARYLSRSHRDRPEAGCPMAALLSDAPRGSDAFRAAFADAFADAVVDRQPGSPPAPPTEDMALAALAMGGLALARAMPDPDISDTILRACRDACAILADAFENRGGTDP